MAPASATAASPAACTATQASPPWHEASLTGLSPAPRQVLRPPRGSLGCGHAAPGACRGRQCRRGEPGGRQPPPDGAASPAGSRGGVTMERRRRRRRGSAGSRGLPPAARALPGEISPWFHHPPPAPKEKFLLRARGSGHPSRAGVRGAALAPAPPLPPLPVPIALRPVALVPRVHRGCTAPAGRAALPRPQAQHRGAASEGGGHSHPVPGRVVSKGPQDPTPPSPPPQPACHIPMPGGFTRSAPPSPARAPPAPASPQPGPAAPHPPLPHSFPFSVHPLQVPEPSPSLRARHRHHRRGLESPAAPVCLCQCRGWGGDTPARSPRAPSPASPAAAGETEARRNSPHAKPGTTSPRPAKATAGVKCGRGPRRQLSSGAGRGGRVNTAPRPGQTAGRGQRARGGQVQQGWVRAWGRVHPCLAGATEPPGPAGAPLPTLTGGDAPHRVPGLAGHRYGAACAGTRGRSPSRFYPHRRYTLRRHGAKPANTRECSPGWEGGRWDGGSHLVTRGVAPQTGQHLPPPPHRSWKRRGPAGGTGFPQPRGAGTPHA